MWSRTRGYFSMASDDQDIDDLFDVDDSMGGSSSTAKAGKDSTGEKKSKTAAKTDDDDIDAAFGDVDGDDDGGTDGKASAAGWGDGGDDAEHDAWGGDDDFADDEEMVPTKADDSKSKLPRGVALFIPLCKQTSLAIRTKKTGSDHKEGAAEVIRELYRDYESTEAEKMEKKRRQLVSKGDPAALKMKPAGASPFKATGDKPARRKACMVCFADYGSAASAMVQSKDVTPWVNCMEEKCFTPLHPEDVINSGCPTADLFSFADIYLHKMLSRDENWVPCATKDCTFGFIVEGKAPIKVERLCHVCGKHQTVEKKESQLDDEFKKMIAEKKLRPCPACKYMTFKEYGVCNVINCAKCAIWWNWRTNEMGKDSRELKEKARGAGTLWEAGELAYQQNLERTNPKEFKALLERNGVKWDPNYVRGRG